MSKLPGSIDKDLEKSSAHSWNVQDMIFLLKNARTWSIMLGTKSLDSSMFDPLPSDRNFLVILKYP